MKRKEIDLLEILLEKFFQDYDLDNSRIITNNRIAKLLKKELTKKKRWKNKNRGVNNIK